VKNNGRNGNGNGHDKPPSKVLRCPEVVDRTGISRATIYRLMDEGKFPRSHQLSPGAVGWSEAEIEAWITARLSDPEPDDPDPDLDPVS
jgi:prophage regulatory protein